MRDILALLLGSALAAPAAAADRMKPPPSADTLMTPAPFECPAPAGWTIVPELDGVTYLGPRDAHKLAVQINVRYIAPGHPSYADADAYLARLMQKPEFEIPGWKKEPVEPTTVAGRPARRARLDSSEFTPPRGRNAKEVPMREEHVVVPAAKGFYVLLYYAPKTLAAKNQAAFKSVLAGFQPKR